MGFDWLGITSTDEISKGTELLLEGTYRATIKEVLDRPDKNCMTAFFVLEDGTNLQVDYYPLSGIQSEDQIKKDKFKARKIASLFTRAVFNKLTKKEYLDIKKAYDAKDEGYKKYNTIHGLKSLNQLSGVKVILDIIQKVEVSKKKNERTGKYDDIVYTDFQTVYNLAGMPLKVKNAMKEAFSKKESNNLPALRFKNEIELVFSDEYSDGPKRNSKEYEWYQSLSSNPIQNNEVIGSEELQF